MNHYFKKLFVTKNIKDKTLPLMHQKVFWLYLLKSYLCMYIKLCSYVLVLPYPVFMWYVVHVQYVVIKDLIKFLILINYCS